MNHWNDQWYVEQAQHRLRLIITPDDVAEAVRRAPNWKTPGLDGLHH